MVNGQSESRTMCSRPVGGTPCRDSEDKFEDKINRFNPENRDRMFISETLISTRGTILKGSLMNKEMESI